MADDDFFKNRYFEALMERLEGMEKKIDSMQSKVNYMYGFAAGVGIFTSLAVDYIRTKMFGPH